MLQEAVRAKDFEKAKEIIAQGGNPFEGMQDYNITSTFDILIREKAFDVIDAFIENGAIEMDIYEYDSFDRSIFMSILKNLASDDDAITFLSGFISKVQNLNDELEGKTLLSLALENEVDIIMLKALVNNGCEVNFINRAEENLIHQVVKKYSRDYTSGLQYLDFLYEQGLDIEKPNIVKETPLHIAVREHRSEYIKWLLDNGADPNTQDKKGVSPFFHAVANAVDLEKYKLMRQYAVPQFDQMTNDGESILYETIRMGCKPKLLQLLMEDGADLLQTSTYYQAQVNSFDVLAQKSAELLKVALDSGQLDVNWKDDEGNTLLHKVCVHDSNHSDTVAKETYRKVKLLLATGADANITNAKEETPMQLASNDNLKTKTVELLLSHK